MGLDARSKLMRMFGLNSMLAGNENLLSAIERWEQYDHHDKGRTDEPLSDDMRISCLQSMCPTGSSHHIVMNIQRIDSYDALDRGIERCIHQVGSNQ